MINNQNYRFVLARAKAATTENEVIGYVRINAYSPRETFTNLFIPNRCQEVLVDPMTVELYTGLRDAQTGERIFEGDVVKLHSQIGLTINPCAKDSKQDYLAEICMPLNMTKEGARRRLYLYPVKGVEWGSTTDGFYEISCQWDSLDWTKVGRSDDKEFFVGSAKPVKIVAQRIDEEIFDATTIGKGTDVWQAINDSTAPDRPLFGTFKRRQHIIRRMYEYFKKEEDLSFNARNPHSLLHPDFEPLKEKWAEDYKKYMV